MAKQVPGNPPIPDEDELLELDDEELVEDEELVDEELLEEELVEDEELLDEELLEEELLEDEPPGGALGPRESQAAASIVINPKMQ